jgi:branched-chain amino acid aminotransferase
MLQPWNEKNRDLVVNVNGQLVHRDEAGVSPFDSAVQGGDAVWEGLRLYNGRIFRLTEHLDRLRSSALALAFAQIPSHAEITEQIRRTLAANRMHDGVHIRLTLTRGVKYTSGMDPRLNTAGPTLIILAEHKPPVYDKGGIALITSSVRRFPPDCLDPKIHHCNLIQSILAKIEANHAGADDALMLDPRGFIAETNATHIFIVQHEAQPPSAGVAQQPSAGVAERPSAGVAQPPPAASELESRERKRVDPEPRTQIPAGPVAGALFTPFCRACPEGITRASVLDLCRSNAIRCEERDLSLTEVYRADEMFCTGTMGELAPVIRVDGRPIGDARPGPMTRYLSERFRRLTETEGTVVV